MSHRPPPPHLVCALLAVLISCGCAAPGDEPYSLPLLQTIALPDVQGRLDHMALDAKSQRLYVAAYGNNTVEVVDLAGGKGAGRITGLYQPQGVLFLAGPPRVAVTGAGDGACRIYDAQTLKQSALLDLRSDADNLRLDEPAHRLYVGYGNGGIASFDLPSLNKVGDVRLAGHPEAFALASDGWRIFVNVPAATQVAVIDRQSGAVVRTWQLPAAENYAMALDDANARLFVACRRPSRLLALDSESGKTVAELDCSGDCDDVFFDAAAGRIYAVCGEGFVDVFAQDTPDRYRRIGRQATAQGARTGLLSPDGKRLFVAVPRRGEQGAEIRIYAVGK